MANRETNTVAAERHSETRIKTPPSAPLVRARRIAARALANNSSSDNAGEVLSGALSQLESYVFMIQRAELDSLNEGADLNAALIRLQEHIAALNDFAEEFLSVEFKGVGNV